MYETQNRLLSQFLLRNPADDNLDVIPEAPYFSSSPLSVTAISKSPTIHSLANSASCSMARAKIFAAALGKTKCRGKRVRISDEVNVHYIPRRTEFSDAWPQMWWYPSQYHQFYSDSVNDLTLLVSKHESLPVELGLSVTPEGIVHFSSEARAKAFVLMSGEIGDRIRSLSQPQAQSQAHSQENNDYATAGSDVPESILAEFL